MIIDQGEALTAVDEHGQVRRQAQPQKRRSQDQLGSLQRGRGSASATQHRRHHHRLHRHGSRGQPGQGDARVRRFVKPTSARTNVTKISRSWALVRDDAQATGITGSHADRAVRVLRRKRLNKSKTTIAYEVLPSGSTRRSSFTGRTIVIHTHPGSLGSFWHRRTSKFIGRWKNDFRENRHQAAPSASIWNKGSSSGSTFAARAPMPKRSVQRLRSVAIKPWPTDAPPGTIAVPLP